MYDWCIDCEFEDGTSSQFANQEWEEALRILALANRAGVPVVKITLTKC